MDAHPAPANSGNAAQVLSKAVVRASERLGIKANVLARILGVSPSTVSRLSKGAYTLDSKGKEWEFALLLVRIYRSLDSIVGNDDTARKWLNSQNRAFGVKPLDLITQTEGIVRVSTYLDASRGIS